MTTTLIDPFTTNDFTEPIRAYALSKVQELLAAKSDFSATGGYVDHSVVESLELLSTDFASLSLDEIRERLGKRPFWDIWNQMPAEISLPENVTFEGATPESPGVQVLALCLGLQLGNGWPESVFVLTLGEGVRGEKVVATTIRDGLRYKVSLDFRSLEVDVEEPDTYFDEGWEYIDQAYSLTVGGNCWSGAAKTLDAARHIALLSLGIRNSKFACVTEIEINPDNKSLTFMVGSCEYRLNTTTIFDGKFDEALPQLIADGVFAELARVAGLDSTAEVGRAEVAKVFASL